MANKSVEEIQHQKLIGIIRELIGSQPDIVQLPNDHWGYYECRFCGMEYGAGDDAAPLPKDYMCLNQHCPAIKARKVLRDGK